MLAGLVPEHRVRRSPDGGDASPRGCADHPERGRSDAVCGDMSDFVAMGIRRSDHVELHDRLDLETSLAVSLWAAAGDDSTASTGAA